MPHARTLFVLFLLAAAAPLAVATAELLPPPSPVLTASFDAELDAPFAAALLRHPLIALAPGGGVDGTDAIRVAYPGSTEGSPRVIVTHPLGERGLVYTLSFDVCFEADFQFVKGGKLHGLGPDRLVAGGNPMRPDGWSARIMFAREAGLQTYLYVQNKPGKYGLARRARDFAFVPGRYHALSLQVSLNTAPGAEDGFFRVYADGLLVTANEGLRYRAEDGDRTQISHLLFSTFHGGNAPDWAPSAADGAFTTVHARFDNFAVNRGLVVRPAPGVPALP